VVLVQNVSKLYRLYRHPSDRIRELIPFQSKKRHHDFWALRDISFSVEKGETLSIVGPNGCGKSTLLQIICGILQPTSGRVVTTGRVAALLELGAGFNPEFTGRENVFLNGEIMGLSRGQIARALPSIAAFAAGEPGSVRTMMMPSIPRLVVSLCLAATIPMPADGT